MRIFRQVGVEGCSNRLLRTNLVDPKLGPILDISGKVF